MMGALFYNNFLPVGVIYRVTICYSKNILRNLCSTKSAAFFMLYQKRNIYEQD